MSRKMHERDEHRWSELVPPHNALTFAAVWDPVEGMIVFSGAHLLDAEGDRCVKANLKAEDSPRDALDNQSQALTIDLLAQALTNTRSTPSPIPYDDIPGLRVFPCEGQTDTDTVLGSQFLPTWLNVPPGMSTGFHSPAIASSAALTGFAHDTDSFREPAYHRSGYQTAPPPFKRMPVRFERPSWSRDSVTDEGFFEGRQLPTGSYASLPVFVNLNLNSAFSVTTTSTNNYVEVDFPPSREPTLGPRKPAARADDESSWAWETLHGVDQAFCLNIPPPERPRRLKKARSTSTKALSGFNSTPTSPAHPAEVLARQQYNHVQPTGTPRSPNACAPMSVCRKNSAARARALLDKLGRCVKHEDEEGWVCVEVKQKVTHKIARNIV
ncbi:hypothetical protein POSPLADRAFT_1074150 [Postia placenta MAD-698-R-SB12]|uniref:Uncharacterized protein n=1 Tax=Postia placenta MAD-698-R-SB12 TaxID=670580 RepID=A0A1X6N5C2_9APHY|nr:hypothetical protein POSPLADRAFT_1074150 [Postia placenta MAD-698-R-SB12]OSX63795.1 hypothetical protein POSPLADRAFT_1074150 [Postia placenta MAD-698-R-SB12]